MVNKLILGTVQFGINYGINNTDGKISKNNVSKILSHSYECGIFQLDTAASYGDSEQVIGEHLKEHKAQDFNVISKLYLKNQTLENSLRNSLERLNVKKLDTILFHSHSDYLIHKDDLFEFKVKYQDQLFSKIGVSVYTNLEVEDVIKDKNIDVVQAPFNILDNASKREETYRKVKNSGKLLHTRSAFLQGLIFKKADELQNEFKSLKSTFFSIEKLCIENNISINELALSYALSKSYIDGVLIGIDNLDQLKKNIQIARLQVPEIILKEIDKLFVLDNDILNPTTWNKN